MNITGIPSTQQRIAIVGAGSAGCGIASLLFNKMIDAGLSETEGHRRVYMVDRDGLLVEGLPGILDFQRPFVQKASAVGGWSREHPDKISLLDVVRNANPTVLIGVSAQVGIFSKEVVRSMAASVEPIIFPLSNPTTCAEATPQDLTAWTDGRAIISTGSPFPPIVRDGKPFTVDQTNNAYVFPGMGLGILSVKARRVSEAMFAAAAKALADNSPAASDPHANLLPPISQLRSVGVAVARAVAREARNEGLCKHLNDAAIDGLIANKIWEPVYRPYRR